MTDMKQKVTNQSQNKGDQSKTKSSSSSKNEVNSVKQTKAVVRTLLPSGPCSTTMPTDFLSSGLRLGGVWADSYRQITSLQEKEQRLTELTSMMAEDIASLFWEKRNLTEVYRMNAASLSSTEVSHLQALQIVDHVRQERSKLESRCTSLESQREWLDNDRLQLKSQLTENQEMLEEARIRITELEDIERDHMKENSTLQELVYARDATIENLRGKLTLMTHQHEILNKSLSTKDRQFQILLKDRNRLKDEVESLKKQLIRRPPPRDVSNNVSPNTKSRSKTIDNNSNENMSRSDNSMSSHLLPSPISTESCQDVTQNECLRTPTTPSSSSRSNTQSYSNSSPSCVADFSATRSPHTPSTSSSKEHASMDNDNMNYQSELDAEVNQLLSQPLSGVLEEAKERQLLRIIRELSKRPYVPTIQTQDSQLPSNPWTPTQRRAHLLTRTRSLLSPTNHHTGTSKKKETFSSPPATPNGIETQH